MQHIRYDTFKNHTVHAFDNVVAYDSATEDYLWNMQMQYENSLAKAEA